jgi:hypothetical protein
VIWIRGTEPRRRGVDRGLIIGSPSVPDWGHVARRTVPSTGTRPRSHSRSRRVGIRDGHEELLREARKQLIALTVPVFIPPDR